MGVFVPVVDGAQLELKFDLGGLVVTNRLWFTFDNPPFSGTDLQGLVDGVAVWYVSEILPLLSSDITLVDVIAADWTSDPPPSIVNHPLGLPGGTSSPSCSANVAVVVPFRWPLQHQRLKRNKHYVPGIPDSAVDVNRVDEGFTASLIEGYADLIDAARLFFPVFNWRWVVASAFSGGSPRSVQFVRDCEGPVHTRRYKIGQRRKRLS